jgi:hypothetical protein
LRSDEADLQGEPDQVGAARASGLAEDPSGNPVELFEPTRAEARLSPA